jgi:hypothetical protein
VSDGDAPGAREAIFIEEGRLLVPTGHACGPWEPNTLHGGGPAALLVRAVEGLDAPVPMLLARLTVEFLGPVPLAPLDVRAQVVRPGRRLQLVEATLWADGREICRARGVRLRREALSVPPSALPNEHLPPPEDFAPEWIPAPAHGASTGFALTGMELRLVEGRFARRGPATAWFRLKMPLVAGEEPSGSQRVVAAADFGNGLTAELSWDTHVFVNTELTVHLSREPKGEWIGAEGTTEHGPEGTALTATRLYDRHGLIGRGAQALYVAAR